MKVIKIIGSNIELLNLIRQLKEVGLQVSQCLDLEESIWYIRPDDAMEFSKTIYLDETIDIKPINQLLNDFKMKYPLMVIEKG